MAPKTRSNLFHVAAGFTKEFHEHLKIVWSFSAEKKKLVLTYLPKIFQGKTEREKRLAKEALAKKLGGETSDSLKAIEVLCFLAHSWNPKEDTEKSVFNDFIDLKIFPEGKKENEEAKKFLLSLLALLNIEGERQLSISTKKSFLPSIVGLSVGIDFRPVISSDFDWRSDDPDKYKPEILSIVPVALLRIRADEKDPYVFQCDVEEIEMIIKKLKASLKEIKAAEIKYFK